MILNADSIDTVMWQADLVFYYAYYPETYC